MVWSARAAAVSLSQTLTRDSTHHDVPKVATNGRTPDHCKTTFLIPSEIFLPVSVPPFWKLDNLDVEDFIDAVMHQLFLGTERGLSKDLVSSYLKSRHQLTSFAKHVHGPLSAVSNLGLAQWKAETIGIGATFGGYQSKNWECYCHLSKWLHGVMHELAPTDEEYHDPQKEFID
jgi:hypothetical protein